MSSITRIVIAAAGPGKRWGNHLDVPKHLIPIMGTTVLGRLVAQFREHGDVVIVGPPDDDRYRIPGATLVTPATDYTTDANKWIVTRPWWNDEGATLYTYGDLFLDSAAVEAALQPTAITLAARWGASHFTGKPYGEVFVWSFLPEHHAAIERALHAIDRMHRAGEICRSGSWELFARLSGLSLDIRQRPSRPPEGPVKFVDLDGWSEDFDAPADWDTWRNRRLAAGVMI